MPIAELAGGMQVLHIAAEGRKPNEYVAVPAVQRLKDEARQERRGMRCRMHRHIHSHDDQQRACGTALVKAATIITQNDGSP